MSHRRWCLCSGGSCSTGQPGLGQMASEWDRKNPNCQAVTAGCLSLKHKRENSFSAVEDLVVLFVELEVLISVPCTNSDGD